MRYSAKQYAESFIAALEETPKEKQRDVVKNFISMLQRNGETARRRQIFAEIERENFKKEGVSKVEVESASEIPSLEKTIGEALGRKVELRHRINPELLAGIKILIDDEVLVDASGRTLVNSLFSKN